VAYPSPTIGSGYCRKWFENIGVNLLDLGKNNVLNRLSNYVDLTSAPENYQTQCSI